MPAVVSAISGVFAAVSSSAIGSIALRLLGSVALSALSQALAPKPKPSGLRTENTLSGGTTPEAFMLGATATGGTFVCPPMSHGSAGKTPNAFLTYVIELAGIPGHQLDGLILNGERVAILAGAPHPDYGQRLGGAYEGRAWIRYHDGSQTTADAMLLAKYPAPFVRPWSADMVGEGICYAVLTFQYDREVFQGWPQCRFELSGVPLYDPRRDSTVGGEGAHRWGQPATYEPSNNTAVQIYNAARGIALPSGDVWGGDIPAEDLPLAVWVAAMTAADAPVEDGAAGTEPAFRSGIEVQVADEPFSVIEELLKGCNGAMTETGGVWSLRLGGPCLPVLFLEDDGIIADEAEDFAPFPPIDQIFNAISATHPDPASLWESRESELRTNPIWEAEDGGRRLPTSLSLPTVPYPVQVDRVCAALIADHRRMRRHVMTLDTPGAVLEAGDTIAWSSVANGYDGKLFEVTELSRDLFTQQVRASLREVDPGDYDQPSGLVRPTVPVPTPVRPAVQSVPGFAVSPYVLDVEGEARRAGILALWDPEGADDARGLRIAIRRAGQGGEGDERPPYLVPAGMAVITEGLVAGDYEVRARLRVDRPTSWTAWLPVTVADVRLGLVELSTEITGWLGALQEWIDGGVIDLPGELTGITGQLGSLNEQTDQINSDLAVINGQIVTLGEQADQIGIDLSTELAVVNSQIASLGEQSVQTNADLVAGLAALQGEIDADIEALEATVTTGLAGVNTALTDLETAVGNDIATLQGNFTAFQGSVATDLVTIQDLIDNLGGEISGDVAAYLSENYYSRTATDGQIAAAIAASETALGASIDGIAATLASAYYTALQTDGAISTAVSALETTLSSEIEDLGTEIASDLSVNYFTRAQTMAEMVWALEGAWQDEIPTSGYATYAGISFSLVSRIDGIAADLSQNYLTSTETNGAISTAVAAVQTALGAEIDGISATLATDHYTKAQTDGEIAEAVGAVQTTLGAQLDDLEGEVATKASASAVNALDTRVTSAEGTLSALASDLTTLSASLGDLEDELATKAGADALSALTVRVTEAEGELVSIAGQIDSLSAEVADKASAEALSALTARVTEAEGELTSVASALSTLTAELAGKADASVVAGLTAQVTEIDGEVTALSGATTIVQAAVQGANLIANGSFAGGTLTGWAAVAPGMTVIARDPGSVTPAEALAPTPHVLRIYQSASAQTADVAVAVPVTPGEMLRASLLRAASGGTRNVTLSLSAIWLDASGAAVGAPQTLLTTLVTATAWARATGDGVTVPAGAVAVTLRLTRAGGGAGNGWVTGLKVERDGLGLSDITASGLFRMEAAAGPSGYSRLALVGRTSTMEAYREAGLYIDTPVNPAEPSRLAIVADQFTIIGPDGAVVPFIIDGDRIYLTGSAIRLTGDTEVDGSFVIRDGDSGERFELKANGLRTYNAAGIARIKLGSLD